MPVDESAAPANLVRLYGRGPRRGRARGAGPCGRRERVTVIGALGAGGVAAAMSVPAATDGAVLHAYLERVLLPELRRTRPDAVLVTDDLSAHKTAAVCALLDGSGFGFGYRHLPPYSPDLNPIEMAWAKALLREAAARTARALHAALGPALDAVSARDAAGFFRHAGYAAV